MKIHIQRKERHLQEQQSRQGERACALLVNLKPTSPIFPHVHIRSQITLYFCKPHATHSPRWTTAVDQPEPESAHWGRDKQRLFKGQPGRKLQSSTHAAHFYQAWLLKTTWNSLGSSKHDSLIFTCWPATLPLGSLLHRPWPCIRVLDLPLTD